MPSVQGSQVFAPFRALGIVSNDVPMAVQTSRSNYFITSAIGRSFHIYNAEKLNLLFVGTPQDERITCIACNGPVTITAAGCVVKTWRRGRELQRFIGHPSPVHLLLVFGTRLVSVDEESCMRVWDIESAELYLEKMFDPTTFDISALMHPFTYLDKILLGSRQGSLQLWNIRTSTLIYTFAGWGSAVTTVVQAPAEDVVVVGLENGGIVLHNLRYDESVMKFQQDWGPVTSASFRTDGTHILATGSPSGHVTLWDLDKRRLSAVIHDAHHGAVAGVQFLHGQPLLATNGPDNSIKIWIFDQTDSSARLLRSRSGHSAPPTCVSYHGSTGHVLLTAGLDRSVRFLSIVRDSQNRELSQGSIEKRSKQMHVDAEKLKLPPVTGLASELSRETDWDSAVSCHATCRFARTWHVHNRAMGKHTLTPPKLPRSACVQCVSVTSCGNFALLGSSNGSVDLFNMQSGLHRGTFVDQEQAHNAAICGVDSDSVNRRVVSAAVDGSIKFWRLRSRHLLRSLDVECGISRSLLHRDTGLLAVVLNDYSVRLIDIDMYRVVRRFSGHHKAVTDFTFSPDGRWLITSSLDCTVRTWDIPEGRLVDCFRVQSPVIALTFSPTADFLATAHADDLAVYLWANRTLFSAVALRPLPSDFVPPQLDMPSTSTAGEDETESGDVWRDALADDSMTNVTSEMDVVDDGEDNWKSAEQLSSELVTLSSLPRSHWHNLANLDLIRQRNKPKEAPTKPKAAPFFLPTVSGLQPTFDVAATDDDEEEEKAPTSHLVQLSKLQPMSGFQKTLKSCAAIGDFEPVADLLLSMGPSAIDAELHMLDPDSSNTHDSSLMCAMLDCLLQQLVSRKNFELNQAVLSRLLKLHGRAIAAYPECAERIQRLAETHTGIWAQLEKLFHHSLCLIEYMKSATV